VAQRAGERRIAVHVAGQPDGRGIEAAGTVIASSSRPEHRLERAAGAQRLGAGAVDATRGRTDLLVG
jgi:hypothetical protein